MKKQLLLSALCAVSLTACTKDSDDADFCSTTDIGNGALPVVDKPASPNWEICAIFDDTQLNDKEWAVGLTLKPSSVDGFYALLKSSASVPTGTENISETCIQMTVKTDQTVSAVRTASDLETDIIPVRTCPVNLK